MFNPEDYDGITFESERDEERELQARADEEERARAINEPVTAAISGWRRAQQLAWMAREAA